MVILPAIDIIGGRAVRLLRGDYNSTTVYGEPADFARRFASAGACWLHAVDLEGARDGGTPNMQTVREIIKAFPGKVEVGGGIRDMRTAGAYISAGAERVIIGTAAVRDKSFLREVLREYGARVAIGVDVRGEKVAVSGWTEDSQTGLFDFCAELKEAGAKTVICTDISRDGALRGPNVGLYEKLLSAGPEIIASGGVTSIDDVRALAAAGVSGAIIGKAYYTGAIDLAEAIGAAKCLQNV